MPFDSFITTHRDLVVLGTPGRVKGSSGVSSSRVSGAGGVGLLRAGRSPTHACGIPPEGQVWRAVGEANPSGTAATTGTGAKHSFTRTLRKGKHHCHTCSPGSHTLLGLGYILQLLVHKHRSKQTPGALHRTEFWHVSSTGLDPVTSTQVMLR